MSTLKDGPLFGLVTGLVLIGLKKIRFCLTSPCFTKFLVLNGFWFLVFYPIRRTHLYGATPPYGATSPLWNNPTFKGQLHLYGATPPLWNNFTFMEQLHLDHISYAT
jgi:hypothetical protein